MKKTIFLLSCFMITAGIFAQNRTIPADTMITTNHFVTINGARISYSANNGMQPVWNEKGKVIATLHYTYYKRTGIKDMSLRPLLISFNGGPGSASVWMQIGYTGPRALNIDSEGYPVQPYGIHENPYSVLDVTDILYVNPVNTGYSRMIPEGEDMEKSKLFFGVNADINYLAEWLNTFVTRHDRWLSPKYLIGESYGGIRVSGLAHRLQENQWMYLNGVILVSPAHMNVMFSDQPLAAAVNLPYFTATAWHHGALPEELQKKDLSEILSEAEEFTINELLPALARGAFIEDQQKQHIAEKISYYSGISIKSVLQLNLNIPTSFFWKELLRDKNGKTLGRLDSRYLGTDKTEAGSSPDYNAEMSAWLDAFTPAINHYMREHLNFRTDLKYYMFGPTHPWSWDTGNSNIRENLRQAMARNPRLRVMFQTGYYDGATTYFSSKYMMWQLDPGGRLKDRLSFRGYRSGHMMYLREEDIKTANEDLRTFIREGAPDGRPAKY
ncbi:MAG TPA: hypothetical protein PLM01_12960 [Bacteroidales bacterium]|jgi:carboxypeptidase C (cathepsin A)|nr:hypothetical protein [Bacteroidales bacterium]HQJ83405.1 hypothetical protein [Bacteroidales bacterium]